MMMGMDNVMLAQLLRDMQVRELLLVPLLSHTLINNMHCISNKRNENEYKRLTQTYLPCYSYIFTKYS